MSFTLCFAFHGDGNGDESFEMEEDNICSFIVSQSVDVQMRAKEIEHGYHVEVVHYNPKDEIGTPDDIELVGNFRYVFGFTDISFRIQMRQKQAMVRIKRVR